MLHKVGHLQHFEHCRPQPQISLVCQMSCGLNWEGFIHSCLLHDPDKDLINHINVNNNRAFLPDACGCPHSR